jgi:hypothetical protein
MAKPLHVGKTSNYSWKNFYLILANLLSFGKGFIFSWLIFYRQNFYFIMVKLIPIGKNSNY